MKFVDVKIWNVDFVSHYNISGFYTIKYFVGIVRDEVEKDGIGVPEVYHKVPTPTPRDVHELEVRKITSSTNLEKSKKSF